MTNKSSVGTIPYSCVHQYKWSTQYNWNIVVETFKDTKPNETGNQRMTDNTNTKRKKTNEQYSTKLKIDQYEAN